MLTQANHWIEIVGTAMDALLLCRVLLLRLQRVYLFITLACLLSVFFDVVSLWLRADETGALHVFLYSRFIYAVVFPLVAWDVFEEMKSQVAKLRRLAVGRLVSGLLLASVFGFLVSTMAESTQENGEPATLGVIGLILWAGSTTAALAFLLTLHRAIRVQKLERPHNTSVWLAYWELTLVGEVLECFFFLAASLLKKTGVDVVDILFNTYGIAITGWCIFKLRALPSDLTSERANASL